MKNNLLAIVISRCLVVALMTAGLLFIAPVQTSYGASVIIGQATNGEGGSIAGCTAGDQSGGEVSTTGWRYGGGPFSWDFVLRAKDPAIAKKLAANMIAACENDCVGYDQNSPDRNSLYDCAEANNWDIAGITTNCETTCASVVSVCLNAAGVNVPRTWQSGEVYDDVMATGQFIAYTSSDYTASPDKLLPGDILVTDGTHTAMVVESPNPFEFDVKYIDTKGEEQTERIEEGSNIQLNLNNGKKLQSVKIKDSTDLSSYKPEKQGAEFAGWKYKEDDDVFVAQYKPSAMAMSTGSKKVKIEE